MKVSFHLYHAYVPKTSPSQEQPAFGSARARKLIERVKNAKTFKGFNVSFEEMVSAYNELGYEVSFKRGSHAVIALTETVNLPLPIPHGNKKCMDMFDLKRLQCVINGDIERALNLH